jgi:tyrosyl-tRNA synthetase
MLTFLPLEQIHAMETWQGADLNKAKEILAIELTRMVHGQEEADKALAATRALFAGAGDDSSMPTTRITGEQLQDGQITIVDLLLACGIAASKNEARRLIQQRGVYIDDEIVATHDLVVTEEQLHGGIKIRKGKKSYHRAELS